MKLARQVLTTTKKLVKGIRAIPGLQILGKGDMSIIAFASVDEKVHTLALADVMEDQYKWNIERQQQPDCLHITVMPAHSATADQFLADLREATKYTREHPELANKGSAAMYGMVAKIPDNAIVDQYLIEFMGEVYHTAADC